MHGSEGWILAGADTSTFKSFEHTLIRKLIKKKGEKTGRSEVTVR